MTEKTVEIHGSHGSLSVDEATGDVLSYLPDGDSDEYADIARFDFPEYLTWCKKYGLKSPLGGDILFYGFWTKDGEYIEPEHEWRTQFLREYRDEGAY